MIAWTMEAVLSVQVGRCEGTAECPVHVGTMVRLLVRGCVEMMLKRMLCAYGQAACPDGLWRWGG